MTPFKTPTLHHFYCFSHPLLFYSCHTHPAYFYRLNICPLYPNFSLYQSGKVDDMHPQNIVTLILGRLNRNACEWIYKSNTFFKYTTLVTCSKVYASFKNLTYYILVNTNPVECLLKPITLYVLFFKLQASALASTSRLHAKGKLSLSSCASNSQDWCHLLYLSLT